MHPYSTDSAERKMVPIAFALAAIVSTLAFTWSLRYLKLDLWWLDLPSVLGFYKLWYFLFDRNLWKKKFFRTLGWAKVPDLNGKWIATGESSHQGKTFNAKVSIKQSWTAIRIKWETDQSRSHSRAASLVIGDGDECVLIYDYLNTPKHNTPSSMHMHRGSVELRFQKDGDLDAEGEYYSGRDRKNYGTIVLARDLDGSSK